MGHQAWARAISRRNWFAILVPLAFASPLGAQSSSITVFAAASLTAAFTEIATRFETAGGPNVIFNFAGSQQLVAQLDQAAKVEVFASADQRWMDHARDAGRLAGPSTVFVRNRLVVITPRANPGGINRLEDLARPGKKLVLAAAMVPAGQYSRQVLTRLGRRPDFGANYPARVLANLVSEEDNVKAVVAKVQLGEADAGIVYRSDITPSIAREVSIIDLPDSANVIAQYPIAVLTTAPNPSAARAFVDFVLSREGQAILARYGFEPVSGK
ncbi:MAG: molybdate ABC transporter substrate-binding protein [Gemmatimonadota bacterium]